MGKKDNIRGMKRRRDEDESDEENEIDPELQAEINALRSMRAEAAGNRADGNNQKTAYNREALERAVDTVATSKLGFVENLQISQFDVTIEDENDDLAREV